MSDSVLVPGGWVRARYQGGARESTYFKNLCHGIDERHNAQDVEAGAPCSITDQKMRSKSKTRCLVRPQRRDSEQLKPTARSDWPSYIGSSNPSLVAPPGMPVYRRMILPLTLCIRRCTAWHPPSLHSCMITQSTIAQRPAKTGTKIEYYVRTNPLANSQIKRPERSGLVRQKRESSVANSYSDASNPYIPLLL